MVLKEGGFLQRSSLNLKWIHTLQRVAKKYTSLSASLIIQAFSTIPILAHFKQVREFLYLYSRDIVNILCFMLLKNCNYFFFDLVDIPLKKGTVRDL